MATITATSNGDFNTNATWVGGVKPSTGDTAELGGHDLTFAANITCVAIQNTAGGTLVPVDGGSYTVTANIINKTANVILLATNGGALTVVGNVSNTANAGAGEYSAAIGVNDGSVVVVGNVSNSGADTSGNTDPSTGDQNATGIQITSGVPLTITGNLLNTGTVGTAIYAAPECTITVTGSGVNGVNGAASTGQNGAILGVGISSTSVDFRITGNLTNYATNGANIRIGSQGAGLGGGSFGVFDIGGDWSNYDAVVGGSGGQPLQSNVQSTTIVRGNSNVTAGQNAFFDVVGNGGTTIVLGKLNGKVFIFNSTLITTGTSLTSTTQNRNDGGFLILLGNLSSGWVFSTDVSLSAVAPGMQFYFGRPGNQPQAIAPPLPAFGGGGQTFPYFDAWSPTDFPFPPSLTAS